jgi:flagellar biosynthetic protein FliQ
MNEQVAADIFRQAFLTALMVSMPALLAALVVGVVISLLQTVTQIHEATLTFIPKIVAVFLALIVFLPWMLQMLGKFTTELFYNIPAYIK